MIFIDDFHTNINKSALNLGADIHATAKNVMVLQLLDI